MELGERERESVLLDGGGSSSEGGEGGGGEGGAGETRGLGVWE